ncbi:Crp/Fnr family transcriptional regulator [bacterium]|nr:Crp/Fnr family transcriptional regulator [bacterium]
MVHNPFSKFKKRVNRGTILYKEHEQSQEIFFIQSGLVKLQRTCDDLIMTLAILEKGDFFGDIGVLNGIEQDTRAEVLVDAELVIINKYDFEKMILTNSEIAIRMLKKYSQRMKMVFDTIIELATEDDKGRVLNVIVDLMKRFGVIKNSKIYITFPASIIEIAGLAGATLNHTQRILDDLVAGGMVHSKDETLVILDKEKLYKFIEYYRWRRGIRKV